MQNKAADALISAAIKCVEELEALVVMLENINNDEGPGKLVSKLREIINLFDKMPLLANDLVVIKRRLRGMLSSDPEKTPRAVSVRDFVAIPPPETIDTRFEPVEDKDRRIETRYQTRPGMGKPPLPKKTPKP